MIVTAPAHYQVVSNGVLVEEIDLPKGRRRTHWKQSVPIASWLYALGVARFAVHHYAVVRGVPQQVWVFPQDRDRVDLARQRVEHARLRQDIRVPMFARAQACLRRDGLGAARDHQRIRLAARRQAAAFAVVVDLDRKAL